jgi:hypothetical protein
MHFRTARDFWTPTDLERARRNARMSPFGEREALRTTIREYESEMARLAEQIRSMRAELGEPPLPGANLKREGRSK